MKKKNLFINQVINSITNFDSYKEVSTHSLSSTFIYFLILILIYTIIMTIGITYTTRAKISKAQDFIRNEVSDINYSNGKLSVNNDEYSSFFGDYIIIDTSDNANLENSNAQMIFGKEKFYIRAEQVNYEFDYKSFFKQDIDKNTLIDALDVNKYTGLIIVISLFGAFIVLSISTLLDILVIALIGFIMSRVTGNTNIKFKNAFNMATHAITLSVILGMIYFVINTFTGFYVKYFSTMYTLLATIYMATAVLLLNSDENNK
ncbi:MAG: DUF1189 domain-containing protein [Clostridia bacterium]|nr:DUF1189 domain-containing protein [Clostridia bacterium]